MIISWHGSETWTQPVPLNVCAFANATDKDAQISSGTIYGPSGQRISRPLLPSHPNMIHLDLDKLQLLLRNADNALALWQISAAYTD